MSKSCASGTKQRNNNSPHPHPTQTAHHIRLQQEHPTFPHHQQMVPTHLILFRSSSLAHSNVHNSYTISSTQDTRPIGTTNETRRTQGQLRLTCVFHIQNQHIHTTASSGRMKKSAPSDRRRSSFISTTTRHRVSYFFFFILVMHLVLFLCSLYIDSRVKTFLA